MKNKKFLMSILSVCMLASCAFGVACGGDEEDVSSSSNTSSVEAPSSSDSGTGAPETESKVRVTLDETSLTMQVYDKATLTATVRESEGVVLWTTSDASVVTVENGNLYAVKEGTATITATVEGVSATCTVTVGYPTTAPVLVFADDVRVNVRGTFEAEMKATWKGEKIAEKINYSVDLVGESGVAALSIDNETGTYKVTGIKAGTTTYRIYATIRGVYVSKDVTITVYGEDNIIVANNTDFIPGNGYYEVNVATANIDGYVDSTALDFSVYVKGKEVKDAQLTWKTSLPSFNSTIVSVEDGMLKAKSAGKTMLVGVYEKNGEELASITLKINAYKPQITLENESRKTLEVGDLQAFEVESELIGTIVGATFHGENVFSSVNGKTVSLSASGMPKEHELLGEQYLQVVTDKVIYDVPVLVYTLIINSAEEFDRIAELSVYLNDKGTSAALHDGYFILGDNISYNKGFIPFLSQEQVYVSNGNRVSYDFTQFGWRAIFDGCGYNIDGLELASGKAGPAFAEAPLTAETGLFGVIHRDGVVKNVSFTNATVHESAGFIASGGGGLIENVYVGYKKFGVGAPNWAEGANSNAPRIMGTFYPARASETAMVRNCVVDVATAIIAEDPNESTYTHSSMRVAGVSSAMNGVIVICPNEKMLANSGANFLSNSYEAFSNDITVNSVFEEWDQALWTRVNGIPFMKQYADIIDYTTPVSIDANATAFVGIENKVVTQGAYTKVEFVGDAVGASYYAGVLTVTEAAIGKKLTLKISTYLNDTTDTVEITVKGTATQTITQATKTMVDCESTALDIAAASQYNGATALVSYEGKILGESNIVDNKVVVDLSGIKSSLSRITAPTDLKFNIITEKDGTYNSYDLTYTYVTKMISTVEDINNYLIVSADAGDLEISTPIYGYYLFVNDVDYAGEMTAATKYAKIMYDGGYGFRGVLEGNGKSIKNLVVNNKNSKGLFGHIGKEAVIKNLTFDNVVFPQGNWQAVALLGGTINGATIENVTINVTEYNIPCEQIEVKGEKHYVPYRETGLLASRWFYNNTVKNVTINAQGLELGRLFGRHEKGGSYENFVIKAKSFREIAGVGDEWADKNGNGKNDYGEDVMQTSLPEGITFTPDAEGGVAWLDANEDGLNDNVTPYVS